MVEGTKKNMETKQISKNEFWLGMAIITFCVGIVNWINPIPTNTTIQVKTETTKVHEVIYCITDSDGVVDCHE